MLVQHDDGYYLQRSGCIVSGMQNAWLGFGSARGGTSLNLTAGTSGGLIGYNLGIFGAVSAPMVSSSGVNFSGLWDTASNLVLTYGGTTGSDGLLYFNYIQINGIIFPAATATFVQGFGATWTWPSKAGLVNTTVYPTRVVL